MSEPTPQELIEAAREAGLGRDIRIGAMFHSGEHESWERWSLIVYQCMQTSDVTTAWGWNTVFEAPTPSALLTKIKAE